MIIHVVCVQRRRGLPFEAITVSRPERWPNAYALVKHERLPACSVTSLGKSPKTFLPNSILSSLELQAARTISTPNPDPEVRPQCLSVTRLLSSNAVMILKSVCLPAKWPVPQKPGDSQLRLEA